MIQEIFLEKNRGKFLNNVEKSIDVDFSTKTRLLPMDNITQKLSLNEQYNKERNECNKYRLMFTINSVCSNVLFNNKTEILFQEGSHRCISLNTNKLSKNTYVSDAINTTDNITYEHAIRNTEYSNELTYHCGVDIFNNHMLRKKDFIHINNMNDTSIKTCGTIFNTILDYQRDDRGDIIKEEIGVKYNKDNQIDMHVYQIDNIMTMPNAFLDNCIEKDGWWGFTNPSTIEVGNSTTINKSINKMLSNKKSCEFVDLYPDRSLFSFVPKYNSFRNRVEKNWDYCITYPYECDFDKVNEICGGGDTGAIKANFKIITNNSGKQVLECSSLFKHNLNVNDFISIYYWGNGSNPEKFKYKVKIQGVGNILGENKDRIFIIDYSDVFSIIDKIELPDKMFFFYKKNNSKNECLYYFRKFKKLKTINNEELKSDINKIAFSKNIYGDDMAQLIMLDDIDVENLVDHNGRIVSELYLTIVKRNAGHKLWYNNNPVYSGDTIEYSHCFGKVTSGIDFCGIEKEPFDYNIHYLHNLNFKNETNQTKLNTMSAWGETILNGVPKVLEDDITIDNDIFYGDIVEYDTLNAIETVIGKVYHRFNTAQRETWNINYKDIKHDEIINDDYDYINGNGNKWSAVTYYINNIKSSNATQNDNNTIFGNISPEGYFYNPHIKIKIKEENNILSTSDAKYINYTDILIKNVTSYILFKNDGSIIMYDTKIEADANANESLGDNVVDNSYFEIILKDMATYSIRKGDYVAIYDQKHLELNWGEVIDIIPNDRITLRFSKDSFKGINHNLIEDYFLPEQEERIMYAYWSEESVPTYAKFAENNRMFTWRNFILPSNISIDSDLYNMTFSNGRFYINNNINFFLKRQDPTGKYGLSKPLFTTFKKEINNPMVKFTIKGNNPIDFSDIMYVINNTQNCY